MTFKQHYLVGAHLFFCCIVVSLLVKLRWWSRVWKTWFGSIACAGNTALPTLNPLSADLLKWNLGAVWTPAQLQPHRITFFLIPHDSRQINSVWRGMCSLKHRSQRWLLRSPVCYPDALAKQLLVDALPKRCKNMSPEQWSSCPFCSHLLAVAGVSTFFSFSSLPENRLLLMSEELFVSIGVRRW